MKKRALVVGLAMFFLVVVGAGPALAVVNETFGLTPEPERIGNAERRGFEIPREPGAVFEDAVRVFNRTDQPLELALYPADAESTADGTVSVGFRGSTPKGVGAWIVLSKRDTNLPPRGEAVIPFRVEVRSPDPAPELGAIVAENRTRGLAADLAQRLHVVVRSAPASAQTTSTRVRPLLLRSPWIIVAIVGVVVALVVIVVGAWRSRRGRDTVVPAGAFRKGEEAPPEGSRPVVRRLGQPSREDRTTSRARSRSDERPLLEDELVAEVDAEEEPGDEEEEYEVEDEYEDNEEEEEELVEEPPPPQRRRERPPSGYIPLDEL